MSTPRKQVRLAAHFPGVNNTTVWGDPAAGSHMDLASFAHLARTAERAMFDLFFLAEGLSLREHAGHLHDLDVVGRPDAMTILAALSAVTEHIGLAATLTTTYHEPLEVARQLATLDHLSDGRAAWNLVTSTDAVSGANFRRGAYLPYDGRYDRAQELLALADRLWAQGPGPFDTTGRQVTLRGEWDLDTPPQGRPVILQAGDSDAGREFAAAQADAVFTRAGTIPEGQAFVTDVKGRLARYGRRPEDLLILPGATYVLGDTDEDAREQAAHVRRQQVSGPTAIVFAEQLWNRDLSAYDPDGPLPDVDPVEGEITIAPGSIPARAFSGKRHETVEQLRALAAKDGLSLRDVMVETRARHSFVGSPQTVADEIDAQVQADACDGFILVPHLTPGGLDEFADRVVPLLQERGSLRTEREPGTLRERLGLPRWTPEQGAAGA
ncbi:LLM class flavin-dependent oxidoreductase [Patulibacter sp.]|uniref:LLM class flavin-dependent oxidoreductase n=1 Tax=Patulibacter sp. TaxID=1912859 RepID=UPI0027176186|nr:LLM class flavin-dependent oxidoreductase [Patulibacter sp.]MDO9407440.1 LLM class flavin-dependent oxidoreductase [Patulibacter sp.]